MIKIILQVNSRLLFYTSQKTHTHTHTHPTHIHTHIHPRTRTHARTPTHTDTHIYTHRHTYMHTRARAHTHTHTHKLCHRDKVVHWWHTDIPIGVLAQMAKDFIHVTSQTVEAFRAIMNALFASMRSKKLAGPLGRTV
jgi:hypothetical protein